MAVMNETRKPVAKSGAQAGDMYRVSQIMKYRQTTVRSDNVQMKQQWTAQWEHLSQSL